jgi:uncharacterized protein YegL
MSSLWLSFDWPWALWGLLLCPALLFALRGSRAILSPRMRLMVSAARVLAVALIVLALADMHFNWLTDDLAVATVVDRSPSIASSEAASTSHRLKQLATSDDLEWLDLTQPPPGLPLDLATRITEAAALLPADRARRILVATDGREPPARLRPAIDAAQRAGITVWLTPMGQSPPIDQAAISGVTIERLVRAEEATSVEVHLFCREAQRAALRLSIDGQIVVDVDLELPAGQSTHRQTVTFHEEGVRSLETQLQPMTDTLAENNTWRSLVQVVPPARVLLIRETLQPPPPLATVLEEGRLQVDVVTPAQVARTVEELDRYHLVVLDEVDPSRLDAPQQRAVRGWVEEGGGLITVTGINAVRREPALFREIEPVMPPRAIPESPPLELILVIDRSSSMSGHRIEMARQAGVAAVRALRADSRVGVVAFSGSADQVIPPMDMSQRDWVIGFISAIGASGGTDIANALAAAQQMVTPDPTFTHHVILLSDGISSEMPAIGQAHALAMQGVSISTISLGSGNHLMSDIAQIGGGRHHVAHNPSELPRLFVREAQLRQPPPFREEPFRPSVVEPMDFLDDVDFAAQPPLEGYVLTELRPGAEPVLATPDGDPLLAHWYVEQGRVMSFTSATGDSWADGWRQDPGFRRLWSQMAWDMLRQRDSEELQLRLDPHPTNENLRIVTATVPDLESEEPPVLQMARQPDDPKSLELERRGPGLWQAEVEIEDGFIVWGSPPSSSEPMAAVAEDRPFSPDLAAFGPDAAALDTLAELGGGRVIQRDQEILIPSERVPTLVALRLPLLLLALVLYLVSVMLQRLPQNIRSRVARGISRAAGSEKKPPAGATGRDGDERAAA